MSEWIPEVWPCPWCEEEQQHWGYGEQLEYEATHGPGLCIEE